MPLRLFVLLALSCAAACAAPFTGMVDGERFTYKVGFAIFPHAGDIVISAKAEKSSDGRAQMRVTTETSSRGLVRGLYEFDNVANVLIDVASGRALSIQEAGGDSKRKTDTATTFDYEKRIAHYLDRSRPDRTADITIPEGDPIDLISALVQTRDWNLNPGEKRDVLMFFGRDLYPLSIYAENYEDVRTPIGKFKTLVLVPRMEKDPKGLFKKGGEIRVWIAQDGSRLPVKMQLKLKFGTALLLMTKYEATAQ